jgi:hypothetical protein
MSKLKARRMARHEQAEVFDKLKPGARRMAGRRSDYSTTMIESRSGAVSPEIEEIVIVFEPARSSKFTLATPTTVESPGLPLVEGKFTAKVFEELALTWADAGEPERYKIDTE